MAESLVGLRLAASAVQHPQSRRRSCAAPAHHRLPQLRRGRLCARAAVTGAPEVDEDEAMSIDNLCRFFDLNVGKWNGFFYQFDAHGRVQQQISTRLSVSTYGEGDLISLMQSLYIKQASSGITFADEEDPEPEWAEYKIKETNMFTVDKYQQIGFFPEQKAFALRYQTAGMLETVLRAGVLGDDDTGEESPKNLKIPSRKPSIVCENCIYSLDENGRVRAFHIMDPNGVLDTLIVFHENQGTVVPLTDSSTNDPENPSYDRINALLGRWEGHSVTKRSGVYGATLDEADTVVLLEMDNNGQLIQEAKWKYNDAAPDPRRQRPSPASLDRRRFSRQSGTNEEEKTEKELRVAHERDKWAVDGKGGTPVGDVHVDLKCKIWGSVTTRAIILSYRKEPTYCTQFILHSSGQ